MNTPNYMLDAAAPAPGRTKTERQQLRSADRPRINLVDLALAFSVMVVTTWGICELNALLLR